MKELTLDSADLTWLSGLARALVRDPHGADDLVQETVLAALRAEELPRERRRAWLATVARRFSASAAKPTGPLASATSRWLSGSLTRPSSWRSPRQPRS